MPMYTFVTDDGEMVDRIVPYDTQEVTLEDGRKAKRSDTPELPARRNPDYGIQR